MKTGDIFSFPRVGPDACRTTSVARKLVQIPEPNCIGTPIGTAHWLATVPQIDMALSIRKRWNIVVGNKTPLVGNLVDADRKMTPLFDARTYRISRAMVSPI